MSDSTAQMPAEYREYDRMLREHVIVFPHCPACGRFHWYPRPACPHCGSDDTTEIAHFGSTACKALRRCNACGEPFDEFKAI